MTQEVPTTYIIIIMMSCISDGKKFRPTHYSRRIKKEVILFIVNLLVTTRPQ